MTYRAVIEDSMVIFARLIIGVFAALFVGSLAAWVLRSKFLSELPDYLAENMVLLVISGVPCLDLLPVARAIRANGQTFELPEGGEARQKRSSLLFVWLPGGRRFVDAGALDPRFAEKVEG